MQIRHHMAVRMYGSGDALVAKALTCDLGMDPEFQKHRGVRVADVLQPDGAQLGVGEWAAEFTF